MKKTVCFLLVLLLLASLATPAFATDADEAEGPEYYTVPVEYSDAAGERENLELMVQDSHVYVNARMLAERLGYEVSESDISVHMKKPYDANKYLTYVTFFYESTKVRHVLNIKHEDNYEAPFASIRNDKGSWIPFRYALLMMNSGAMITDNALLIDMPDMRIVDEMFDIYWNGSRYRFDWADDFGYSDSTVGILSNSSHVATLINGLLKNDGDSWRVLFQSFYGSSEAYDEKYGKEIALLLCTESDMELEATIEKIDKLSNIFGEDGILGSMLSSYSGVLDDELGERLRECSQLLEQLKQSNSAVVAYNKAYQALESVFDEQSQIYQYLDSFQGITKTLEAVGYCFEMNSLEQEFKNRDRFSVSALQFFLRTRKNESELPTGMIKSIREYTDLIAGNLENFMANRFTDEVLPKMVTNAKDWAAGSLLENQFLPLKTLLITWNIVSSVWPPLSSSISSADSFKLAGYALWLQDDAYWNYTNKLAEVFQEDNEITAEKLYELSQYCHVYLKSCYIAREAAVASLKIKISGVEEKLEPLMNFQNSINKDIAAHLVALKAANLTNKGGVYGFLLSDNREYLKNYDDSDLILWLRLRWLVSDAYSGDNFHIPRINMKVGDVPEINEAIANDYYHGRVEKGMSDISDITYHWNVNRGLLSLVIKTRYDWGDQNEYQVYNVSVDSGKRVPDSEVISMAGMTESEYQNTVRLVLGSQFFKSYSPNIISEYIDAAFYWEQAERTVSDENIQACLPYLNEEGQLCITGFVYGLIGPGGGRYEYNLEKYEVDPYCLEYLSRKDRAADSDSFVDRYGEILLRYPSQSSSYALYDIDKNGTPELIIREGGDDIYSEYWVYSYTGSEVVESECNEWYSYDAVFASGGNELIILYGGAGSSRIECLYRYKLAGGQLVYVEEIMNTEADSMLEMEEKEEALYAYLDQLTPLSFSPVSDTSSLENYRGA